MQCSVNLFDMATDPDIMIKVYVKIEGNEHWSIHFM
jgi:hypothetical protein